MIVSFDKLELVACVTVPSLMFVPVFVTEVSLESRFVVIAGKSKCVMVTLVVVELVVALVGVSANVSKDSAPDCCNQRQALYPSHKASFPALQDSIKEPYPNCSV